jgi:methylase of polypeptide subunit release factors
MLADTADEQVVGAALGMSDGGTAGLLSSSDGQVCSTVELAPCAVDDTNWVIASDWSARRTGLPTASDHVLGVGGASTMLAQCTVRPSVESALDVGTGCGIQAFHLAGHCRRVVASDISGRCLDFAKFNAAMNGMTIELREGNLFAPVVDERFDLIVSNPPFVIGSPASGHHDYRDFGGAGDAVCRELVTRAEEHLNEGGWCQLLANWEITDGEDWSAHPRGWVSETGADAWVIQREVQDPAQYVEMWLRDAGHQHDGAYGPLYDEWLTTLEGRGVVGVGFGLVTLRWSQLVDPVRRFQHVPQAWQQPVGAEIDRWFAVQSLLAAEPAGILMRALRIGPDVTLEVHGWGTDQQVTMLRRASGMCWSGPIDDFGAQLLATLDGVRPAAEAVLETAETFGIPPEEALSQSVPALGRLAEEGFVLGAA